MSKLFRQPGSPTFDLTRDRQRDASHPRVAAGAKHTVSAIKV